MKTPHLLESEKLAVVLAENFRTVQYDQRSGKGWTHIPNVGVVNFRQSANDPAVILELQVTKRFKGDADNSIKFLEILSEAWSNSD
jgi:hypothetical protein